MRERGRRVFYPRESTLGKNCIFWDIQEGCTYVKTGMTGRKNCEGMVDDVCLLLKNGRIPKSLTPKQLLEVRTRIPNSPLDIPPGDTIP